MHPLFLKSSANPDLFRAALTERGPPFPRRNPKSAHPGAEIGVRYFVSAGTSRGRRKHRGIVTVNECVIGVGEFGFFLVFASFNVCNGSQTSWRRHQHVTSSLLILFVSPIPIPIPIQVQSRSSQLYYHLHVALWQVIIVIRTGTERPLTSWSPRSESRRLASYERQLAASQWRIQPGCENSRSARGLTNSLSKILLQLPAG